MKYEINGHIVEVEKQLSDIEIDDIATQLGKKQEAAPKFYEIEKQQGTPKGIGETVKQIGGQFVEGLKNPMPGSLLSVPVKAMSETASQFGADIARKTEPTLGTVGARVAGFGAAALTDPLSYTGGLGVTKNPPLAKSTLQSAMKPGVEEFIQNLQKQKGPLKEEIETQTAKVMDTLDSTVKKYGDVLNKAKKDLGLPVTNAEREASLVEHGNAHGLSKKNINKLYEGIIAEPKNSTELAQNIHKFKSIANDISDPAMKARLASVLQDNINKMVDWTKSGDTVDGVLKSQYKELKQLALPETLKTSKKLMADALDLSDTLSKKMEEPGQAEAFLRQIITGKSARNKDHIQAIRHLEELSGEKLFDSIQKAVVTEKSADAAIKKLQSFKGPNIKPAPESSGITVADILKFKLTGWTSVVSKIMEFKDTLKNIGNTAKKPAATGGTMLARGINHLYEGQNKQELDKAIARMKNAK